MRIRPVVFVFLLLASIPAQAAVRMAQVFQDHMVLQRGKPVPIWGWADPGTEVRASFAGQEKSAKADGDGYWRVIFDPLTASASGGVLTVSAGGQVEILNDVVVGEVWICAGQSNMARTLKSDAIDYPYYKDYAKDADYPAIRFINYSPDAKMTPQTDFQSRVHAKDKWEVLSTTSAMNCMSVPMFFAKALYKELSVPIGLVQVAVPGTPQTAWMAKETLDEVAAQVPGTPDFQGYFQTAEGKLAKGKSPYKTWAEFDAANALSDESTSGRPLMADSAMISVFTDFPTVLYNTLVYPLAPIAIQGVIWHQGESGPGPNYKERLIANLAQWRKLFGQEEIAFVYGSIARNTTEPPPLSAESVKRPHINEELLLAAQATHGDKVALVNFTDLGNANLHWAEREEAGKRMAGAALANVYGRPESVYTGPELVEAKVEGSVVKAKFRNVGGGLVHTPSVDGISGFVIEEKGGKPQFRWASSVTIDGDTVSISDPDVKNPVNVYYGWAENPHETLFNKEGYPAFSFRMVPRLQMGKVASGSIPPLVELLSAADQASLNILHVRQNGYLFNLTKSRGPVVPGSVKVRIPKQWKSAKIMIGDNAFEGEPKTDAAGITYYDLPVDVNGPSVIVSDAANPPDFSKIDRF